MAKNSQETRFLHLRNGHRDGWTDGRTDGQTDGRTDQPFYRDVFLTDASKKNGKKEETNKQAKGVTKEDKKRME